jgi:hypothetical protein
MTVRKSSIFMHRASLNQDLVRETVSWAAVSSLVKPTNSQINLENQKVNQKVCWRWMQDVVRQLVGVGMVPGHVMNL